MERLSDQIRNNPRLRQAHLRVYLFEHGISIKDLAEKRGLSRPAMSDVMRGRRPKPEHIAWLIGQGIPAELLPSPVAPKKRGPKPKHPETSANDSQEQAA